MGALENIFGPSAADSAKLSAIFGSDDFSDVAGGSSSTAMDDDLRRRKLAQMAQARQLATAHGLGGPAPTQGVGARLSALGDRFVTGAADTLASIPELYGTVAEFVNPSSVDTPDGRFGLKESPYAAGMYPTIGKPGGFLDLAADRQNIRQQAETARERFLQPNATEDPSLTAAVDTLALGAGMAIAPGGGGARAAEEGVPALARAAGAVEEASPQAAKLVDIFGPAATTPEEAAFLAKRAEAMRSLPGTREPVFGPGAVADSLQPESKILGIGAHPDAAAQDVALGLRARPQDAGDAAELARVSQAIDENAAPSLPRQVPPSLEEIFGDRQGSPGIARDIGSGADLPQNAPIGAEMPRAPFSSPLEAPPAPETEQVLRHALTGEELPLDTPYTGTMHAITRAEQDAAGLPRTTPASRVDAWEEARQVFEQDPQAPRALAQEVAAKPRPLSDFENHLLAHDRAKLKPAYQDALTAEEQALASGDPAQAAAAKLHRLSVERDYQLNADAADLGGSESGRGLQARQVQIGEDYSPLQLVRRYRVANLGEDAPDAVRSKLVDVSRQLEAAQTRLAAAEERAQTLEAQRMIHAENQMVAREIRSKGRAAATAGLDQEYTDLSAEWRKATGLAQAGVNPDQAVILAKMARNRVRAGVTNLQDLVDGIFQDARPHLDTLEPQDVRDAITGAGPVAQKAARKQAVSDFAVLRREARVLNALDGAQAKLAAVGDSKAQALAQKEITRWEAELERIHGGARQAGGPLSDPERLRASLARNATRQAELRDQIASGTIIPKTRAPVADYALLKARAETEQLRRQADAIIGKRELQNRSWLQKGLDLTAATARFMPLTSVTGTLPKLAAAASWRSLVFRPAEQLLSVADPYLPLLRELGSEAPVEGGGVGLNALKKSYQGFFSREARTEAMAHLRGEEGPLALALGKPHQPSGAPAFMDYPSHLHAALKSPAVVASYNWAMETQAARLARAGAEITPELRMTMEGNAWEVALRDILLNDNAAVQRFNLALQKLPQDSTATRVGIAAVRSQLPIVKVATNYPLQATDYLFGLPKFGIRAGKVIYRGTKATAGQEARTLADIVHAGIQASPPGYADQVVRNLKRGRLGAALAGLVLSGAVEAGGYYRKGEHRSESDLQPGEIRIGGSNAILQLPHNVLHSPPMEAMQVVGTFKRSKSFGQGLGTSALGLAEQTPFFEESVRLGRDLPNNPAKFAGMAARQISEPPDIQKLARVLDQDRPRSTPQKVGQALGWAGLKVGPLEVPEIKARKRTPHGDFLEQLLKQEELGIPGLRDNVR